MSRPFPQLARPLRTDVARDLGLAIGQLREDTANAGGTIGQGLKQFNAALALIVAPGNVMRFIRDEVADLRKSKKDVVTKLWLLESGIESLGQRESRWVI